jgi:hypothetical protein
MNTSKSLAVLCALLLLGQFAALADPPFVFRLTLRGTVFQTNTLGQVVQIPITETNILQDAAAAGGISDLSTLALVYHIHGGSYGDTIEVVYTSSGARADDLWELAFGEDGPLNAGQTVYRTALTNSPGTEVRRLDYIYMYHYSTYTAPNNHSMGACFTTKRFQADGNGNYRTSIEGQMQWIVNPYNNAGTKVCTATFRTTKPFVAGQ